MEDTSTNTYELLERIHDSCDVRSLPKESLVDLCSEIRGCLIDTVSKTAGHFASGLGVVELTVALHYVYDTPNDKLVWDVGHQAYPHKILTGHREELGTIRKKGGLHAFIWRGETPHDLITTGHASTSIGSALGLAVAESTKDRKDRKKVVAVIGDGALSGGCAFEAMNHAGSFEDLDLTVILNDNEMSISENVGRLHQGLSHVLSSPHYVKMIEGGKRILEPLPALRDLALRAQEHFKGMLMPGTLFEEFGFNYIGPVDGHDVNSLVSILQNIRDMPGLTFLHVVTTKGKGYEPAEKDPICYHGVAVFDPDEGIQKGAPKEDLSYSAGFGRWMCDKAKEDPKLMAVTPAMRIGSGLAKFAELYPKQFFDVAIAEQHAMVFASGLAAGGMRPVVNIYSSFMQRAYDGLIHDMAIQNLPIILCLDRGGLVGADGPTHNGAFDIAYTRTVPNLTIMVPSSRHEQYTMLNTAYALGSPCVIRYPRDNGESLMIKKGDSFEDAPLSLEKTIDVGSVEIRNLASSHVNELVRALDSASFDGHGAEDQVEHTIKLLGFESREQLEHMQVAQSSHEQERVDALGKQHKIALLVFGPLVNSLQSVCEEQDITLINMRFVKPLNEELIQYLSSQYDLLVTVEEAAVLGGVGEHISSIVASIRQSNAKAQVLNLGMSDSFVGEGNRGELLADLGLDRDGIMSSVRKAASEL